MEHRSIANTPQWHAELVTWAQSCDVVRVGIEGSGNYGRPASETLIAAAVSVVEVPPQMTAARATASTRGPGTEGHAYYQRCLDRGKTKREAIRALKRRISDRVWTHLQADLQHAKPDPCLT